MATQGSSSRPDTPNKGVNTPVMLSTIGAFFLLALLAAMGWFWYAGHHALSATPQQGATGVGGMTAGTRAGHK